MLLTLIMCIVPSRRVIINFIIFQGPAGDIGLVGRTGPAGVPGRDGNPGDRGPDGQPVC